MEEYRVPTLPSDRAAAATFLTEIANSAPPAERAGHMVTIAGLGFGVTLDQNGAIVATPPTADPTATEDPLAPVEPEYLLLQGILDPLEAKAKTRIDAVNANKSFAPYPEVKRAEHEKLKGERVADVPTLVRQYGEQERRFLAANAAPSFVLSADEASFQVHGSAVISTWMADDALTMLEHAARTQPRLLDCVHNILRRITEAPPRHWKDSPNIGQPSPVLRASEILQSLPPAPRATALARAKRAEKLAGERRVSFAKAVARYVERGTWR